MTTETNEVTAEQLDGDRTIPGNIIAGLLPVQDDGPSYAELTTEIVAAYVSHNSVPVSELGNLISTVSDGLRAIDADEAPEVDAVPSAEIKTKAEIKKSITHDALISFIDGKPYKMLRRHLSQHGLTPETYRAKYGLPLDYPMTSPSYSEQRSQLATAMGLGQQRRKSA